MRFFKKKEKVLNNVNLSENKIHNKESLLSNIEEQHETSKKIVDDVYKKIDQEAPQKLLELGTEECIKWQSDLIENAKKQAKITILAENMHFFEEPFFRVVKSSERAASNSIEAHPFIETIPGQVSKDIGGEYGLCFVTSNNLILYLSYGDEIAEIDFDLEKLKEFNLSKNEISFTPHGDIKEFNTPELLIKDKAPLKNPETLKRIIKMSDDKSLSEALSGQEFLQYSKFFEKFGLFETAKAWDNVMSFTEKRNGISLSDARFIREHIDQIIPEITIDTKLNSFNAINNNNITIENKLDAR